VGDKIENKMGGACNTYGEGRSVCTVLFLKNLREGDHLGDPGLDVRTIFRRIFRKWDVGYGLD
jgi:hypothetical protein